MSLSTKRLSELSGVAMANETAAVDDEGKKAALAAYNKVVAGCELVTINLVDARFKVDPGFYDIRAREKTEAKSLTRREFDCDVSTPVFKKDSGLLAGRFLWKVEVLKGKKKLVTLQATYVVLYKNVPDVGEEHISAFLQRVGRFASYPYFRGLFSRLAAEAQLDLPVLPVLK